MNEPYEEIIQGERTLRLPPGQRHELICSRLHALVKASVGNFTSTRLLDPRAQARVSDTTTFRPDLALIVSATGKLWLAGEIISADDHHTDTVIKKQIYEEIKVPRLWIIDPRYDNVEVYHSNEYGLALKEVLAGREVLAEKLLPEFQAIVGELFSETQTDT